MKTLDELIGTMQRFLLEEPSGEFHLKHSCGYSEYDLERMAESITAFDTTGRIALVYLSVLCREQIADTVCPVSFALGNDPSFQKYRECMECVDSPVVAECRAAIVGDVAAAIGEMSGRRLVGTADAVDAALDDAIETISTDMRKLKFEVYANPGIPVGKLDSSSVSVQACQSLAECILRLEKSPDGIYVCYVSNPGTLDGWFGFFVKSNGNMFSYNERIDEAYVGQHRYMRNGRYAEDKAYGLFPYEMCEFSDERDYKGYSREVRIGDRLKLVGEGEGNYDMAVRVLLAMGMIAQKHVGLVVHGEPVVVNSLLAKNIARLDGAGPESTALVEWRGSPIVKRSAEFAIPAFEEGKVLRGEYDAEYNGYGNDKGIFWGVNQDIVDAYGDGFRIDSDALLASDSSLRLIGNGDCEQEFIGSPKRIRLQAYYEVRRQLAKYISSRMCADFNAFGGADGLREWFMAKLRERMNNVLRLCVSAYDHYVETGVEHIDIGEREFQKEGPRDCGFLASQRPMSVIVSTKKL
ncbi:MAG: hypothetical protein IKO55_18885, partial [Kiritimatiellae bacterium]|nr:hypothetical protein [Kiritimatiellia bacterium]